MNTTPSGSEGLSSTEVELLLSALNLLDDDSKSTVVYLKLQKRLQRMKKFWDARLKKPQTTKKNEPKR